MLVTSGAMSKGRRGAGRAERLLALYAAGDHGGARSFAAQLLADPSAGEEERNAAREIRARTATDLGVAVAGIAGFVAAVAISVWLVVT